MWKDLLEFLKAQLTLSTMLAGNWPPWVTPNKRTEAVRKQLDQLAKLWQPIEATFKDLAFDEERNMEKAENEARTFLYTQPERIRKALARVLDK